jgi:isopentenyl diphosphate isomerase/L-lactate dehydrogenase-like FMN-dependent dehydrogenase
VLDGARHPGVGLAFPHLAGARVTQPVDARADLRRRMREMLDGTVTWKDLEWIREEWYCPTALKACCAPTQPSGPPTTGWTPRKLASLVVQFFALSALG